MAEDRDDITPDALLRCVPEMSNEAEMADAGPPRLSSSPIAPSPGMLVSSSGIMDHGAPELGNQLITSSSDPVNTATAQQEPSRPLKRKASLEFTTPPNRARTDSDEKTWAFKAPRPLKRKASLEFTPPPKRASVDSDEKTRAFKAPWPLKRKASLEFTSPPKRAKTESNEQIRALVIAQHKNYNSIEEVTKVLMSLIYQHETFEEKIRELEHSAEWSIPGTPPITSRQELIDQLKKYKVPLPPFLGFFAF